MKTRDTNNIIEQMVQAKAILAPMSGVTDIPCRMMARKFGCKFAFTEMIDINGIVYNNRKSFSLLDRVPGDSPLGVQLVGQDKDKFLNVARICQEKGFKVLDINAGCPARKVVKGGKGSALLKDPMKLAGIVHVLVKSLNIPVTVKIRSGWDESSLNYIEIAKAVCDEGASSICIHSRTTEKMYKGKPDHEIARHIKETVNVPVFASGNIFSAQDAMDVLELTGCDGIYVARGVLGQPWIFREIDCLLNGVPVSEAPSFDEIKEVAIEHFSMCQEYYDARMTKKRMNKYLAWYLKGFKKINNILIEYRKIDGFEEFESFMSRLCVDEQNWLYLKA